MAQPTAYNKTTDFTTYSSNNPTDPQEGTSLDTEFDNIETTLDEVLANLAVLQRDDTFLANSSVGRDQLKAEVVAGINTPAAWVTATAYTVRDSVIYDNKWYWCDTAHTSSAMFATDIANWTEIVDFASTLGFDSADITTIIANLSDISAVADNETNINTVANNIGDISAAVAALAPNKLDGTRAPTANDDSADTSGVGINFDVGSTWADQSVSPAELYVCTDDTATAAEWVKTSLNLAELGTIVSQDASDVTLTGGTMDSVAVTNGTVDAAAIGATTPDTGAFTTLSASGACTLTGAVEAVNAGNKFRRYSSRIFEALRVIEEDDAHVITFPRATRLYNIYASLLSGTLTLDVKKNGINIGGINAVSVTSTQTATAVNDSSNPYIDFAAGDKLSIDKSSVSAAFDLEIFLDLEDR